MQKKWIDLHIHTLASDGLLSPEEVVKIAKDCRLSAISITDHDAIGGFVGAKEMAEELGIELVSGVELSVTHGGDDFHLLAYLIRNFRRRSIASGRRGLCAGRRWWRN